MAANLNFKADGSAALYLLQESAWHNAGTVVNKPCKGTEVMDIAGLNWSVRKEFLKCGPKKLHVPGKFGVVREDNDTILGVVGSEYTLVQNSELFSFCASLAEWMDNLTYETAGALGQGETVWTMIRLGEEFKFGAHDKVLPYLLVSNNHNGSRNMLITPTTVRVVCENTINMASDESKRLCMGYKIMHTESIHERMQLAKEMIIKCSNSWKNTQEIYSKMADKSMSDNQFDKYLVSIFGTEPESPRGKTLYTNRSTRLNEIFHSDTCTVDGLGNTVWSGMNAVTEYLDHDSNFHKDGEDGSTSQARLFSTQFGNIANKKNLVWDKALALV